MFGSRYLCLLIAFVVLLAGASHGQANRADSSPEFASPDFGIQNPRVIVPPVDPAPGLPHPGAQAISPGTFGFAQLAHSAGTIFSGTVTAIKRVPKAQAHRAALETVAITFQVENAIRGATTGESLTISQWMGLWSGGQRYRIGDRVLLFLYPASKLGLTSCVAYPVGRFPVDSSGRVLLSALHLAAFRTDPVLGGKTRAPISDFALAVRRSEQSSNP